MIIATKASGREGRTENTVGKGTSWHMWYREGTQRRVCSLFSFTGWSRVAQYEWNRGMGGGSPDQPQGCCQPRKPQSTY